MIELMSARVLKLKPDKKFSFVTEYGGKSFSHGRRKDKCTMRKGMGDCRDSQAVRAGQRTRSDHTKCVFVLSPMQLSLFLCEKVGFGMLVLQKG
jgi:hypothetical protein